MNFPKKEIPVPTDPKIFPPNSKYEYLARHEEIPFNHLDKDFNINNSWWLSELSLLAYERPNFIKLACRLAGFNEYHFFNKKKSQCFVANNKKVAIVVFRGTKVKSFRSVSDLLIDIKFQLEDFYSLGKVHTGFKDSFESIWSTDSGLHHYLESLKEKHKDISIWFTGHSLGGALALLASSQFETKTPLYTFGCPKVGDQKFSKNYKGTHFRVVNGNDIIVQLPPKLPIPIYPGNSYKHTGKCYRIMPTGEILEESHDNDDKFLGFLVDNTIKVSGNIFSNVKKKVNHFLSGKKLNLSGKEALKNVTGTISKYYLKDITSHAPVFYSIRIWNSLADKKQ